MKLVTKIVCPPWIFEYSESADGIMAYTNQFGTAYYSKPGESYKAFFKRVENQIQSDLVRTA